MKNLIYVVIAMCVFACDNKKDESTFEVEGVIKNTEAKTVYLEENIPNGQLTIIDSAKIINGAFQLNAIAAEEIRYQLRLAGQPTPFISLINDAPAIKLKIDFGDTLQPYVIEGSHATQAILNFDKTLLEQTAKIVNQGNFVDSLKFSGVPDSIVNVEYMKLITSVDAVKNYALDFFKKSDSPIAILYGISSHQNALNKIGLSALSKEELARVIKDAAARFPNHKALQSINKNLAPDFTQPDSAGRPVALSSFKGKYVLLDFWASWCKPCRLENPKVVKAYQEFKDKNFTVFGVSLDQDKQAWLAAIEKDGLTWTHASDLKYWSNEAAVLYGVQSIPANFLIDPEGNIVARDLSGEEMVNTLRRFVK